MPMPPNPFAPRLAPVPVPEDGAPDAYDETASEEILGRFACGLCADNRDAAERAEAQLNRAHALLRLIQRAEVKPVRSEGLESEPTAQALLGHVSAWAVLKARIDLYFQSIQR